MIAKQIFDIETGKLLIVKNHSKKNRFSWEGISFILFFVVVTFLFS